MVTSKEEYMRQLANAGAPPVGVSGAIEHAAGAMTLAYDLCDRIDAVTANFIGSAPRTENAKAPAPAPAPDGRANQMRMQADLLVVRISQANDTLTRLIEQL